MRLTSFTDFGLRALMRMAAEPGRGFTTDEIAREFAISRHHLTKVVGDLSRAGFIVTQRGGGGGLRLARPPADIRIGAVVRALESREALVEALTAYTGAVVLVSHDMHLLSLVADRLWLVKDGGVAPFEEDLEAYRALLLSANSGPQKAEKKEKPKRASRDTILALKDLPLTLAGKGWEKVLPARSAITYLGLIHPDEVRQVYDRSKVILNVSNTFHETHERLFDSMASGAVAMSNETPFYREHFTDQEVLFFDWSFSALSEKVHALIQDEAAQVARAEAGRKAFLAGHSWRHRAEALLVRMEEAWGL